MKEIQKILSIIVLLGLLLSSCTQIERPRYIIQANPETLEEQSLPSTPFPTRPVYEPGTLVEYIAQPGDTLAALSVRFNTTEAEIRKANPIIPLDATTMPPGFPMQIPIYYRSMWGTDYQIIPDYAFVNGPSVVGFDIEQFLEAQPGWFKSYKTFALGKTMDAAEMLDWVCNNYSINPKLLMALIEYQTGALSNPTRSYENESNFLGHDVIQNRGVYLQISFVTNLLNDGYYKYRNGDLITIEHLDGKIENTDPWQNAATVSLQYYFSRLMDGEDYLQAIGPNGLAKTFADLFGDPWLENQAHIPGSLTQPAFILPFERGTTWAYTGGPHTAWGSLAPWAAIDFAPPSDVSGCADSDEYATAVAAGVVVRTGPGILILDLDFDGDERTGWVIFYLHIAEKNRVPVGTILKAGERLGHPSCEGGRSTGTHIHIARKYNGEWILADSIIPFNLSGWVTKQGAEPYKGYLEQGDRIVIANTNPNNASFVSFE